MLGTVKYGDGQGADGGGGEKDTPADTKDFS